MRLCFAVQYPLLDILGLLWTVSNSSLDNVLFLLIFAVLVPYLCPFEPCMDASLLSSLVSILLYPAI